MKLTSNSVIIESIHRSSMLHFFKRCSFKSCGTFPVWHCPASAIQSQVQADGVPLLEPYNA